ncbi:MAG: hypothetical protein GF313_09670, partial [Caldithrix sp.]|nr:hypothetical protein [Caldithrix sp.]
MSIKLLMLLIKTKIIYQRKVLMWMVVLAVVVIILLVVVFEYRIRKPDQMVLKESKGLVQTVGSRFYPRHFCLAISGTIQSKVLEFQGEARGRLPLTIKLSLSIAPDTTQIHHLIRTGGWQKEAVHKAFDEVTVMLQSRLKSITEHVEMEQISSDKIRQQLSAKMEGDLQVLGLKLVTLNIQSIEPVDETINQAIQQQEAARIREETEKADQQLRYITART